MIMPQSYVQVFYHIQLEESEQADENVLIALYSQNTLGKYPAREII